MGTLLSFTPPVGRRPRRTEARPDARIGGAQILFYTGVRIERHADASDTPSDAPAGRAGPEGARLHRQA